MNAEETWRLKIERELGELTTTVDGHAEDLGKLTPKVDRHDKLITLVLFVYTAICGAITFFAGPITDFIKSHIHFSVK